MKPILAIDPGTRDSAIVLYDPACDCYDSGCGCVADAVILPNPQIVRRISADGRKVDLAIEMFDYLGQDVGRDVFTTVLWIGRFVQAYYSCPRVISSSDPSLLPHEVCLVHRREIKMHLCGTMRAKDKNIRQAIIDRFGGKEKAIGKKKAPGPLYGVKSHEWQALAVALTYHDRRKKLE